MPRALTLPEQTIHYIVRSIEPRVQRQVQPRQSSSERRSSSWRSCEINRRHWLERFSRTRYQKYNPHCTRISMQINTIKFLITQLPNVSTKIPTTMHSGYLCLVASSRRSTPHPPFRPACSNFNSGGSARRTSTDSRSRTTTVTTQPSDQTTAIVLNHIAIPLCRRLHQRQQRRPDTFSSRYLGDTTDFQKPY